MDWVKHEDQDYYSCHTPIGEYEIVGGYGYSSYFRDGIISRFTDLETAKEEARTHLTVLHYKLKRYLDL